MKLFFALSALLTLSSVFAATDFQATCEVNDMESSVKIHQLIGKLNLEYPANTGSTSGQFKLPGYLYVGCSYDNRMSPVGFNCEATEASVRFMVYQTTSTKSKFQVYGQSPKGRKIGIICELEKN